MVIQHKKEMLSESETQWIPENETNQALVQHADTDS